MSLQKGGFLKKGQGTKRIVNTPKTPSSRTNSTRRIGERKPPPPKNNGKTPRSKAKGNLSKKHSKPVKPSQSERQKQNEQSFSSLQEVEVIPESISLNTPSPKRIHSPPHVISESISLNTPSPPHVIPVGTNINTGKQREIININEILKKSNKLKHYYSTKFFEDKEKEEKKIRNNAKKGQKLEDLQARINAGRSRQNNSNNAVKATLASRKANYEKRIATALEQTKQETKRQIEEERKQKLLQNEKEKEAKKRNFNKQFYIKTMEELEDKGLYNTAVYKSYRNRYDRLDRIDRES